MSADARELALAELDAIYRELEAELAALSPRCELSGRCCDFKTSGHELFATELEVDHAKAHGGAAPPSAPIDLCPFWKAGRCELRDGRPLGCRVYFCDPAYADAMPEIAERYHRRIVSLHERFGLDYRYRRFILRIREPQ